MKKTILRYKLQKIIKELNNTLNSVNPKAAAKILGAGIIGSMLLFGTNINAVEPSAFAGYNEQQGKVENKNKETKEYNPQMYSNDNRSAFGNGISVTNKVKGIKQKVRSPTSSRHDTCFFGTARCAIEVECVLVDALQYNRTSRRFLCCW
jgi:hypothetical protein